MSSTAIRESATATSLPTPVMMTSDQEAAAFEGWTLFQAAPAEADLPASFLLMPLDSIATWKAVFQNTEEAWRFVVFRARGGSELHRRALALVDPLERMLIEATFGSW